VHITRTVAGKSSNRLKFYWVNVIYCICQSNELEREIKHNTRGAKQEASQKSGRAMAHPAPPLKTASALVGVAPTDKTSSPKIKI